MINDTTTAGQGSTIRQHRTVLLPAANACSLSLYDAGATSSTSTFRSADIDGDAVHAVTFSTEIALIEDDVS